MNLHFDRQQIDAVVAALVEASQARAAAGTDNAVFARVFQAVAPELVRIHFEEANRGTASKDIVDGYIGVFGWWLSQVVRNGCPDPQRRLDIVQEFTAEIATCALARLDGGSLVASITGQAGGHA